MIERDPQPTYANLMSEARTLQHNGQGETGAKRFQEAAKFASTDVDRIRAEHEAGVCYAIAGEFQSAWDSYQRAENAYQETKKSFRDKPDILFRVLLGLGRLYRDMGSAIFDQNPHDLNAWDYLEISKESLQPLGSQLPRSNVAAQDAAHAELSATVTQLARWHIAQQGFDEAGVNLARAENLLASLTIARPFYSMTNMLRRGELHAAQGYYSKIPAKTRQELQEINRRPPLTHFTKALDRLGQAKSLIISSEGLGEHTHKYRLAEIYSLRAHCLNQLNNPQGALKAVEMYQRYTEDMSPYTAQLLRRQNWNLNDKI